MQPALASQPRKARVSAPAPSLDFGIQFVRDAELSAHRARAEAEGLLIVGLEPVPPVAHGCFRAIVEDTVEALLMSEGAEGPLVFVTDSFDAVMGDQVRRAEGLGYRGICLAIPSLRSAYAASPVPPDDSESLQKLCDMSSHLRLRVLFAKSDESLPVFAPPVPLAEAVLRSESHPPFAAPSADDIAADHSWEGWATQLVEATGPQSLSALEKLVTGAYMPLLSAIGRGLDHPRALAARDDFRRAFEKSYIDAHTKFVASGRRPRMVLDAFDVAAKVGRAEGARGAQIIVVDGMRWDLGQDVLSELTSSRRATLVEQSVLWAALPTTTARQLDTLAKGPDALRSPSPRDQEFDGVRGRTADYMRRVRVGSRDIIKLDIVESRLREAGAAYADSASDVALSISGAIAKHIESITSRTLLLVLGDHGFMIERGSIRQGGASPEEVIVPCFAFIVDDTK